VEVEEYNYKCEKLDEARASYKQYAVNYFPKATELAVTHHFFKLYYNYFAKLLKELC